MADHAHHHASSDKGAAFTGLVVGALLLLATVVTVVKLTNSHFAARGHEGAAPAAAGAPATH